MSDNKLILELLETYTEDWAFIYHWVDTPNYDKNNNKITYKDNISFVNVRLSNSDDDIMDILATPTMLELIAVVYSKLAQDIK